MSQEALANFREIIFRDQVLQNTLREITNEDEFVAAVCSAAQSYGLALQADEIQAAVQAARRAWIERWIA